MNDKIVKFETDGSIIKIFSDGSTHEINFHREIKQFLQFGSVAVLRLLVSEGVINENVFGVSCDGKILWQIEPVPYVYEFSPYTNLSREDNFVKAWNFTGNDLTLDPATGKIVKESYSK